MSGLKISNGGLSISNLAAFQQAWTELMVAKDWNTAVATITSLGSRNVPPDRNMLLAMLLFATRGIDLVGKGDVDPTLLPSFHDGEFGVSSLDVLIASRSGVVFHEFTVACRDKDAEDPMMRFEFYAEVGKPPGIVLRDIVT